MKSIRSCHHKSRLSFLTIVQGSINLVHDEERSRAVRVDREKQGESSYSLLATAELFHIAESLHRRHGVELHASTVRFFGIVETQVSIPAEGVLITLRHVSVDSLEGFIDMIEGLVEAFRTLVLDALKVCGCLSGVNLGLVKIDAAILQPLSDARERFIGLNSNNRNKTITIRRVQEKMCKQLNSFTYLHVWGHSFNLSRDLSELVFEFFSHFLFIPVAHSLFQLGAQGRKVDLRRISPVFHNPDIVCLGELSKRF